MLDLEVIYLWLRISWSFAIPNPCLPVAEITGEHHFSRLFVYCDEARAVEFETGNTVMRSGVASETELADHKFSSYCSYYRAATAPAPRKKNYVYPLVWNSKIDSFFCSSRSKPAKKSVPQDWSLYNIFKIKFVKKLNFSLETSADGSFLKQWPITVPLLIIER
jgi:hypothetical protein